MEFIYPSISQHTPHQPSRAQPARVKVREADGLWVFRPPGAHLLPLPLLGLAAGLLGLDLGQPPVAMGQGGELALQARCEGAAGGGRGGIIWRVCVSLPRVDLWK